MRSRNSVSRRSVLRRGAVASGAVLFGRTAVVGRAAAGQRQADLPSRIEDHGHYAWFPFGPDTWGRSSSPFDFREGDSRWLARPTSDGGEEESGGGEGESGGGVRCLVSNVGTEPANRSAGFDLHLGPLGELDAVTVDARTVQTQRTTGSAVLFVGLYLDKSGDGEFFAWESEEGTETEEDAETEAETTKKDTGDEGDIESWAGIGGDEEGITSVDADGESTIDGDTTFSLVTAGRDATLEELQNGAVGGIDGETRVALYLGVTYAGDGTEEAVVEEVTVRPGVTTTQREG